MRITMVFVGLVLFACNNTESEQSVKAPPKYDYPVFIAERGDVRDIIPARGVFEMREKVVVGSEVSGRVIKVNVRTNDAVKKGQILAELDPEPFIAAVRQAEADVKIRQANITAQMEELDKLHNQYARRIKDKDFLDESREFMDNLAHDIRALQARIQASEAQLKQAQANLHIRRFNLKKTKILSPMDGFVLESHIEPGNSINAAFTSPELFVITGGRNSMQITAEVSELDISRLKKGMMVRIKPASDPNKTLIGQVEKIETAPDRKGNFVNYSTIISTFGGYIPNSIKPGMSASLEFVGADLKNVPRFPIIALYTAPYEYEPTLKSLGISEDDIPVGAKKGPARHGYLSGMELHKVFKAGKRPIFTLENGKIIMRPIRIIGESQDYVAYDEKDMPIGTPVIIGQKNEK